MEQVKIFHDRTGNTLTVWFGNPQEEYVCEETGDEVILMKDRTGRVIGFEKLNFSVSTPDQLRISFETVSMWGLCHAEQGFAANRIQRRLKAAVEAVEKVTWMPNQPS